ncbi:MAG: protein-disulfide reductase DsbD family protein [Bacteriovoracaceae bacterium]
MIKYLILLFLSCSLWAADDHATISATRWRDKIVITIDHDNGWHTYWKNPGDAGIPSSFKFSSPTEEFEWPAPTRHIEEGNILTIGYSGKKHFFFKEIPNQFDVHVTVLICKDICIPGEAKLTLGKTQKFTSNRPAQEYSDSELNEAFEKLPKIANLPSGFEYYLTRVKDQNLLTLHYSLKVNQLSKLPFELNLLTAFPLAPWGFKRENLYYKDGTLYGKTEIEWDGEYQDPPMNLPASGQFEKPYSLKFLFNSPIENKVNIVTLSIKDFSNSSSSLDDFYKKLPPFDGKSKVETPKPTSNSNILTYILFAFLGGLILNLMPCVLPVISLKLFGLIKHQNAPRQKLLSHNLSYTAGVISTFMALALIISGLKATGEEIGWGFQLQSPTFILIMMLILFIMSLNLFGLFEFVTPGGSTLGNQKMEDGLVGDFFSGILTTILSTPCSAPFLGTALTFAFTTEYYAVFLIFFFIGLGLSFPFLLTAFFPQALHIFPKPGAWMEKLKYFLGLSLVLTTIWLYDVFVSLVDFDLISWRLNLLFALWFFAFFFTRKISRHKILQFLIFAIPLTLTVLAIEHVRPRPIVTSTEVQSEWTPWSEEKLSELKGQTVFMDFTAEWCLTCKVNKKLVFETEAFRELAKKNNITLLRADWTKRDDNITQYLRKYQAVGVPAYFIQRPNGEIVFLGETISLDKIKNHL